MPGLVARTYDKYIIWTDSVKALTAQDELNIVKKKYDESLATIQEKDDSLSAKQYIIIGLCILAAVLAAALAIGAVILLRFIMLTRKQKKAISIANEHNELKTEFIQNISSQMEPTLDTLDPKLPGVQALRAFSGHIQGAVRTGEQPVGALRSTGEKYLDFLRKRHGQSKGQGTRRRHPHRQRSQTECEN